VLDDYGTERVQILSINPINRDGNVIADAKMFKLPYPVLIGAKSSIVKDYGLMLLPQLVIIDVEGNVALFKKFVLYEELSETLDFLLESMEE
jgi:hypothetical protein